MQGISTITQKGQVAIPKPIRDQFGLKPKDRIRFSVEGYKIIARPALSVKEMRGFIKTATKKPLSKSEMKRIIQDAVVEKFKGKHNANNI